MGKFHKKVITALRGVLPDVVDALQQTPSGRVTGVVISGHFNRKSYQSRQKVIDGALKKSLTSKELEDLGPIIGLTPAEMYVKA